MMLYILTGNISKQTKIFTKIAKIMGIEYQLIDLLDDETKVWLSDEVLKINNQLVISTDTFYLDNLIAEFPFIPGMEPENNYQYFSYSYVALQQRKSQTYSVLSLVGRKYKVSNDFNYLKDLYSKIDVLSKLDTTSQNIVDYYVANTTKYLKNTILFQQNEFFWSSIEHQSPLKKVQQSKIHELLQKDNFQPYIFYKITHGTKVRIWILQGKPILAAVVTSPKLEDSKLILEQYEYSLDLDFFAADAKEIYSEFKINFLEIYGIIDKENKLTIYGLDPTPTFTELDNIGREWLAGKILENLCDIKSSLKEPTKGERQTVFLKKMLEPLFHQ